MMRSELLAACALAAVVAGCSSGPSDGANGPNGPQDGVDAATDGATDAGSGSSHGDGAFDSGTGGAPDSGEATDARAPAAPSCASGDRSEWAGVIPNTMIAVAVCSACGESYVVAANGSAASADVTVGNGTSTVTATAPAGGMATTAKIADNPADGTVSVCGTSGSHGCLATPPVNQRYCNPYRSVTGLRAERIDQGVDYGGAGPIYALGPGKIDLYQNRNDTGWPGGTFVSYKVSAGPAAGKVIYLAENIDLDPSLHAGSFVYSGTVLGTLVNASPDSESGWGVAGAGYTAEHSCYVEACDTVLGDNFNDLLVCLKATPGVPGSGGCCTSTAGYPSNWCTLLSAWQ
jgi:hypothetical protein